MSQIPYKPEDTRKLLFDQQPMPSDISPRDQFIAWNGPICGTCLKRYLGYHTCTAADLRRRIGQLQLEIDELDRRAKAKENSK